MTFDEELLSKIPKTKFWHWLVCSIGMVLLCNAMPLCPSSDLSYTIGMPFTSHTPNACIWFVKFYQWLSHIILCDPVYSAKKAGLGRGSARPFCHCKRTKRPNARPKTAAAETISRGSLGRGSARPFLTVNASRPKCGTKCDPRIRKYVWSSWHHRIWRHYPAFFFDRCSYFVFFFFCGDYQICPCKLLTKT